LQSFRGSRSALALDAELVVKLRALARQEGATLFMVLLAGFQAVLSRWSGQDDVVVGTPIAGRTRRELEGLIGFFANTLAMRTDLSGDPTFRELLLRVKESALGAYEHQDLPFERLVQELQPARDLARHPVFQTMFALHIDRGKGFEFAGLRSSRVPRNDPPAQFDVSLRLRETVTGLQGAFEYATDIYDVSTIERLAERWRVLLEAIAADPDARLSELAMLPEAERRQLVEEWNETCSAYPSEACLHDLVTAQAMRTPDAVAVIDGGRQLSYAEIERRANRLAHHLRGLGVGAESIVGVCVERSAEMVIGLLGILKAGGAYLPLDPAYPVERLGYMLSDAGAGIVVTQAAAEARL
ncbi:condensation domain-containing protein, partial [Bradyrhizobium sp. PRIMUS42]|uniref:condensation domain-containing protein n=2 Tax=unclassified Bradyrhizobium TaxID=2631580 RepID=UPI001FF18B3C